MKIEKIDHFVLTVKNIEQTCEFYQNALGMDKVSFNNGRIALKFGNQKINLHEVGKEFEPKAKTPLPGTIDICFITKLPSLDVINHFKKCGILIEEGPVNKTGAVDKITSVYIRDPDGNLIEISNY